MKISEMNTQIIKKDGKPVFAVIPYDAYIDFMGKQSKPEETETNLYVSKLNDLVCSMGMSVREHV
jgi:hypothetical protein